MVVRYRQAFLKDLKKIKGLPAYKKIFELAFVILPESTGLQDVANIKAMQGYPDRYRIRVGDYRIGIENVGDGKEFYRFFP